MLLWWRCTAFGNTWVLLPLRPLRLLLSLLSSLSPQGSHTWLQRLYEMVSWLSGWLSGSLWSSETETVVVGSLVSLSWLRSVALLGSLIARCAGCG
jgi:hypothetical protein